MASLIKSGIPLQKYEHFEPQKDMPILLQAIIGHDNTHFALKQFFKEILSRGPEIIVVTNGSEGVYAATKEAIYFHPSLKEKVVSTLGAGDAFGSCFVASLAQNKSIPEALVRGTINATSVIKFLDAKTGLLTQDALEKQAKTIGIRLIQKFKL